MCLVLDNDVCTETPLKIMDATLMIIDIDIIAVSWSLLYREETFWRDLLSIDVSIRSREISIKSVE